jgi:hypothetical protein
MTDFAGPNHVQVNISHAPSQVLSALHGCGMVPSFPEGTRTSFTPIILLGNPAGYQLHGFFNDRWLPSVIYKQMHVVAGDSIV